MSLPIYIQYNVLFLSNLYPKGLKVVFSRLSKCFLSEIIANVLVAFTAFNLTSTSVQRSMKDILDIQFPWGNKIHCLKINYIKISMQKLIHCSFNASLTIPYCSCHAFCLSSSSWTWLKVGDTLSVLNRLLAGGHVEKTFWKTSLRYK